MTEPLLRYNTVAQGVTADIHVLRDGRATDISKMVRTIRIDHEAGQKPVAYVELFPANTDLAEVELGRVQWKLDWMPTDVLRAELARRDVTWRRVLEEAGEVPTEEPGGLR